jgi:hypothetical protein
MPQQSSQQLTSESSPLPSAPSAGDSLRLLQIVFFAFFAQIAFLILASLVLQDGPVFVGRTGGGFSMDYGDFYLAAMYHARHLSIYSTGGFVWPPFSILVGQLFQSMPFETARYWWLALNLCFLIAALAGFSRQIKLSRRDTILLYMIAAAFYPTYFLLERGHIDGLMLACLVFAFRARHWALRSLLFGMSIGLKLYSALLVVLLARKKQWAVLAGGVAAAVLIQLPWLNLALSYPHVLSRRTSQWIVVENITPAPLFFTAFGWLGQPLWKLIFLLFWLLTLMWFLLRLNTAPEDSTDWVLVVPWMIAMPLVVYPYSAVLTLPLLAYQSKQMEGRQWGAAEWLFASGFVLIGTQQNAWTGVISHLSSHTEWVYLLNSLGSALLIVSCCMLASRYRGTAAERNESVRSGTAVA